METSLLPDPLTLPAKQSLGLGFTNFLIRRHLTNDQSTIVQASTVVLPVDAIAPPPVKRSRKTAPRLRRRRRTRRRLAGGDEGGGGEEESYGFFGDGGDGDDGLFGNGGAGGGGGGSGSGGGWSGSWNFDGFEGENFERESSGSSGFAADFVYEVVCWIALSNCVHFAFKRFVRILADGVGDPERTKVTDRLGPVC